MQRTRADRLKRIILIVVPIVVLGLCILFDQLTKIYFRNNYTQFKKNYIIKDFFYFTYTINDGAAWSFLSGVTWAQLFFKILTGVALVVFGLFMFYALKKEYKWLSYSLALIIGGTCGNFIDRLIFDGVTDFIGFSFGSYNFPIFNLADSFLVVGLIMLIIHYAFLDENAIFKKNNKTENAVLNVNVDCDNIEKQSTVEDNGDKEISDK